MKFQFIIFFFALFIGFLNPGGLFAAEKDLQNFDETLSLKAEDLKEEEPGVGIGTVIPHNLAIPDHRASVRNFDQLKGRNGMVLYIIRSAVWCPYCIFQLREISVRGSAIEDLGYNIVVLSYDSVRKLSIFAREYEFPYPILSDKHSVVIQSFGLLNEEYQPGTSYYGVAHPATYVIGNDGLILHKFYNNNFKKRPSVGDVRDLLMKLGDYEPIVKYYDDFD